ncbi:MAG: hypothetical protein U5K31_11115 [Balneolaceae bacterium]|nr:hypothetical protein [Balneolaceae bacterium]
MEQQASHEDHTTGGSGAAPGNGGGPSLPPDDADWSRIYWITGLLGLAYIIILGLFTLLFNTPAS